MAHTRPRLDALWEGEPVATGRLMNRRLVIWRLVISGLAFVGFGFSMHDGQWETLSNQAALAAGVTYAFLAARAVRRPDDPEPSSTWLQGALALLLSLVALVFAFLLGGGYGSPGSLLEHLVVPVLVVIDFCVVARNPARPGALRWWYPLTWLLPPLGYLAFYLAAGLDLYAFLDAPASALAVTVAALAVTFTGVGYLLMALARRT